MTIFSPLLEIINDKMLNHMNIVKTADVNNNKKLLQRGQQRRFIWKLGATFLNIPLEKPDHKIISRSEANTAKVLSSVCDQEAVLALPATITKFNNGFHEASTISNNLKPSFIQ